MAVDPRSTTTRKIETMEFPFVPESGGTLGWVAVDRDPRQQGLKPDRTAAGRRISARHLEPLTEIHDNKD